MSQIETLRSENASLKARVVQLEKEVEFLTTHPALALGIKGEKLVATLVNGELTAFAAQHDVAIGQTVRIEVKTSNLHIPVPGRSTRRWDWSKPMGWKDKGKDCDLLILLGEKDLRYPAQYLNDDSPFIFFLIPMARVPELCTSGSAIGANLGITTNLAATRSPKATALKQFIVSSSTISAIVANAIAA